MLKKHKGKIGVLLLLMALFPAFNVSAASSTTVHNQAEFKEALDDEGITTIVLGNDIETTEKINILRPVTIDGAGHAMKYVGTYGEGSSDNTVWGGIYVLQVYKTTATIKDIKLTNGNGGLLVNGGHVTFVGTIDVSGNGFGGIELGQGVAVESSAHLVISDNAKIVNTTESSDKPTLWVPEDSTNAILEMNGVKQVLVEGQEFLIQEINSLFTVPENPNTSDPFTGYIVMILFGIISFGYSMKKLVTQG